METTKTKDWIPEDEDFGWLVNEEELSRQRQAAEAQYDHLTFDQYRNIKKAAKEDLYFLSHGFLEYDLLSPTLHGSVAKFCEDTRDEQFRLFLLPRDHYKSTMLTIADSVQIALPGDLVPGLPHPYNLGPNAKLLIAHENRESASRFLYEITAAFTRKPAMLAFFPELIPSRSRQRINKWELELPREQHHKEPTFDTIGAGGAAQGRHYHKLKLDDLVGEDARDSQTVMERILTWFDNVNSLLTRLKIDGWDLIGTRWAATDVYSHAMSRYGIRKDISILNALSAQEIERMEEGLLVAYIRSAIEHGQSIFPEEFPLEVLEVLRKNKLVWASQYANNPRESGLNAFETDWLKFYNVGPNDTIIRFTEKGVKKDSIWNLDRVIFTDPSMGESVHADPSGIIVTGTDERGEIIILETVKKVMSPPELMDEWFRLYFKWRPRILSIEEVNFSAIFKYWFQEKCREKKITLPVYPYKPGSKRSKEGRVFGLANYFSAGQVWISQGMHDFRDEYEWFPLNIGDKHLLDALAQGPEVWQLGPGGSVRTDEENQRREAMVLEMRSALTGY